MPRKPTTRGPLSQEHRQKLRDAMASRQKAQQKEQLGKLLDLEQPVTNKPEDLYALTGAERVETIKGGSVSHRGPQRVVMYDSQGRPSYVTTNNLLESRGGGLRLTCPLCGSEHANPDDPNSCPAQEKLKWGRCPMPQCGKRIHDDLREGTVTEQLGDDPNQVALAFTSTPESRIKARVEQHVVVYHPRLAQEMGLMRPDLVGAGR